MDFKNISYFPADSEMIPFLQKVFSIKNIFFLILIAGCFYTWFYMPFPFENALFQMPKDV